MTQPDLGQEYRLAMLRDCLDSGDAFSVISMAKQQQIEAPVLTLLEPGCQFGGRIIEALVRGGMCSHAEVDGVLHDRSAEARPLYAPFALTCGLLRSVMEGTKNMHIVQLLDALIEGAALRPAVIAAGNSITATGYDPAAMKQPRPADLARLRRKLRARRHGR